MAPSSSLSREIARARRTWLSDCTQSHRICGKGNTSQLPLRDLDVQIRGSDDKIRLVDFSRTRVARGRSQYDRCCALSYCWGEFRSRFITTSATIKSNRRGILVQSVPKTFYDAVIACREMSSCACRIEGLADGSKAHRTIGGANSTTSRDFATLRFIAVGRAYRKRESCSKTELTFGKDQLAALSGLAK